MLAPGKQLGPYEIVGPLGAGAMGEVYRARDNRLLRDVAVKILPDRFVADQERLRRFEQEAHAAGRLNHPNILAIHDVGTHQGTPYVVSELLDGQTLRERLDAGPLPVRRTVELALQMAEGLATAHDHGIIHRDLKPENLFVTRDGRLKILDFGLAKLTHPDGERPNPGGAAPRGSLTGSMTIVGTAGYMAPEQVLGQPADSRSDIFAFGAILYEMLGGQRAFKGSSSVETMAAILNAEPAPLPDERPDVPPGLDRIIERCLEKDPVRRFQSAHDLAFVLGSVHEAPGGLREDLKIRGSSARRRFAWVLPAAAAGIVLGAAIGVGITRLVSRAPEPALARFSLTIPQAATVNGNGGDVVISPDGRTVALVASDSSGAQQLWIRPIGSLVGRRLEGADGAGLPFWSPDSRFIAFFANGRLLKIPAAGGPVVDICPAPTGRGGTWNRDNIIVFTPASSGPLHRVPAGGGESVAITHLDSTRHETAHRFPHFLPDGRHFLFASLPARQGNFDVFIGALDSKEVHKLMTSAAAPIFAPPGWLLFSRNGQMMVQRFDPGRRRLQGQPVPIGEANGYSTYDSEPAASASATGTLAFPNASLPNTELVWFDLQGHRTGTIPMPTGHYEGVRISPDGRHVAVERRSSVNSGEIWVAELARGIATRFVFDLGRNFSPAWSPDGKAIVYSSNRAGANALYIRRLGGSGQDDMLPKSNLSFVLPLEWSRDGRFIVLQSYELATSYDIWSLSLEGERKLNPLLQGLANEAPAALSPDGRWLGYVSDESGGAQFYVQSFPVPGERYQVSVRGTFNNATFLLPVWLRGGRQVVYPSPDGVTLMVADVIPGATFQTTTPRPLFRLPAGILGLTATPDGSRLLATVPSGAGVSGAITLVQNWTAQLKR